jgi:hypothetical protein
LLTRVAVTDSGPCGVCRRKKSLTAEFVVHAIVNLIEPPTECFRLCKSLFRKWLQLIVIRERGAAVFTGQHER